MLSGRQRDRSPRAAAIQSAERGSRGRPNARPVDFSKVPVDLLVEMDDEIAKMGLSPEDRQLACTNLAGQYLKAKAVVEALNR